MANLSFREKADFEQLFGMRTGYVIDFSNNSFASFVGDAINIDIYSGVGYEEYSSKANKLRQIWSEEPDNVVGTLMEALLNYYEDYKIRRDQLTDYDRKKIGELHLVTERLKGNPLRMPQGLKLFLRSVFLRLPLYFCHHWQE